MQYWSYLEYGRPNDLSGSNWACLKLDLYLLFQHIHNVYSFDYLWMVKVLRILEGDVVIDKGGSSSTPCYGRKLDYDDNTSSGYGSQSSRMFNERVVNKVTRGLAPPWRMNFNASFEPRGENNSCDGHDSNKLSYEALKAAYKDKSNTRRLSYEDIM